MNTKSLPSWIVRLHHVIIIHGNSKTWMTKHLQCGVQLGKPIKEVTARSSGANNDHANAVNGVQ